MEKKLEQENKKLDLKLKISNIMNDISPKILQEIYIMGRSDGYETGRSVGNICYGTNDKVNGFNKTIEIIYEKHINKIKKT